MVKVKIENALERHRACTGIHLVDGDDDLASAYHGPNWFCFFYNDLLDLSRGLRRFYFRSLFNAA